MYQSPVLVVVCLGDEDGRGGLAGKGRHLIQPHLKRLKGRQPKASNTDARSPKRTRQHENEEVKKGENGITIPAVTERNHSSISQTGSILEVTAYILSTNGNTLALRSDVLSSSLSRKSSGRGFWRIRDRRIGD